MKVIENYLEKPKVKYYIEMVIFFISYFPFLDPPLLFFPHLPPRTKKEEKEEKKEEKKRDIIL